VTGPGAGRDASTRAWLAALAVVTAASVCLGAAMKPKVVEQKAFAVIGIQARTNNAKEATGEGAIPRQWGRFFQEGILEKIPNKADSNLYAVYSDYATNRKGDYDFVIGARVSDPSVVPAGMVLKQIPAGKYAVLTSAKGQVQSVVPQAWQTIWSLEDQAHLGGIRAYKADFELYDQRGRDPQNSEVDLYIGLR
jgi:predicted transcriptional regulator YdeE